MIRSFADKETARIMRGEHSRRLPRDIQRKALMLLRIMDSVDDWTALRSPPGNRLHALGGDRGGSYAIRINDQRRIVFHPSAEGLVDVEITDYH